ADAAPHHGGRTVRRHRHAREQGAPDQANPNGGTTPMNDDHERVYLTKRPDKWAIAISTRAVNEAVARGYVPKFIGHVDPSTATALKNAAPGYYQIRYTIELVKDTPDDHH